MLLLSYFHDRFCAKAADATTEPAFQAVSKVLDPYRRKPVRCLCHSHHWPTFEPMF